MFCFFFFFVNKRVSTIRSGRGVAEATLKFSGVRITPTVLRKLISTEVREGGSADLIALVDESLEHTTDVADTYYNTPNIRKLASRWDSFYKLETAPSTASTKTAKPRICTPLSTPPSSVELDGCTYWEVSDITAYRGRPGDRQYLVHWKGISTPTWENEEHVQYCKKLIKKVLSKTK